MTWLKKVITDTLRFSVYPQKTVHIYEMRQINDPQNLVCSLAMAPPEFGPVSSGSTCYLKPFESNGSQTARLS